MRKSGRARRYLRLARQEHGTALGELYYSLADRDITYGVSATCAECPKKCKISGVPGVSSFWCGDKINK